MSANKRRAGSGRRQEPPRTAGIPATTPARAGRRTAAGFVGFGSAAALAGAGMAMLASPGSVSLAVGAAHTAQQGVQKATLTASVPQPNLPSNQTVAPAADPPGNLVNPGSQRNNPTVGVQLNANFPFSTDPGVLFDTPNGSATAKVNLPSMLFGDTAGGSGTATVTSSQAGSFVNNFLGFATSSQPQGLASFVQNSRDSSGNLPNWTSQLGDQLAAGVNQNNLAAFNALFGPGGSADNAQNITEALLPQPYPTLDLFNTAASLNALSSPDPLPSQSVPLVNPFAQLQGGSLNLINTSLPTDNSGADFAARFSASSSDPFSAFNINIPNPVAAPATTNNTSLDTGGVAVTGGTANVLGGQAGVGFQTTAPASGSLSNSTSDFAPASTVNTTGPAAAPASAVPAPTDAASSPAVTTGTGNDGTGGVGVVTTTTVTSQVSGDLQSTVPTVPTTFTTATGPGTLYSDPGVSFGDPGFGY